MTTKFKLNKLFFFFSSLLISISTYGQWQKIAHMTPGTVKSINVIGDKIFTIGAVNQYISFDVSVDTGTTWQGVNAPHQFTNTCAEGSLMIAASDTNISYSSDTGYTWVNMNYPPGSTSVSKIFLLNSKIFFSDNQHLYSSVDTGQTWIQSDSGLISPDVKSICMIGSLLVLGGGNKVYLSNNNGQSWLESDSGITSTQINTVFVNGTDIYVGADHNIFISTDSAFSWHPATGIGYNVNCFTSIGNDVYAGMDNIGIKVSSNHGASWTSVPQIVFGYENVKCLASYGPVLLANVQDIGIYSFNGSIWQPRYNMLSSIFPAMVSMGGTIIAGSSQSGIYVSNDEGATWQLRVNGINFMNGLGVNALLVTGDSIYAAVASSLYLSTDTAKTWQLKNNGIPSVVSGLAKCGSYLYCFDGSNVYSSSDQGNTWNTNNNGLPFGFIYGSSIAANDSFVYIQSSSTSGVYRMPGGGSTWTPINIGLSNIISLHYLVSDGSNIYIFSSSNIYKISNNSNSWTQISNLIAQFQCYSFALVNGIYFAGTGSSIGELFVSYDSCATWNRYDVNIPSSSYARSFVASANYIFTSCQTGIYRTPLSQLVAVPDLEANDEIKLYPNPATSEFRLQLNSNKNPLVIIRDITGKEITRFYYRDNEVIKSNFTPGLYVVSISDGNKTSFAKLVIR